MSEELFTLTPREEIRRVNLNFGPLKTPEEVQTYIAEQMKFPPYYGKNLDALYECLTEIPEDTEVLLYDPWRARPVDVYIRRVARVFVDAAGESRHLRLIWPGMVR